MSKRYDGIILIDKNDGETSFGVVKRVRRILKVKKAGHSGTLDPFATGLLVVLLGQGTKLSSYLMSGEKLYRATMRLGIETDTQDPTGQVVQVRPVPDIKPEEIKEKAMEFIGEIEQVPPIFSAVRYGGKRAYELARNGIKIDLEKRKVKIHSLKIISVALPDVTMEVTCSSGTYIRSLASDLGKQLGPGGHLKDLRRLSSAPFTVKDALDSKHMGFTSSKSAYQDRIIPLLEAIPHLKEVRVDDRMAHKIRTGYQPEWEEVATRSDMPDYYKGYMKLVEGIELVAIMKVCHLLGDNKARLKITRVFN
ncbi:MAG: tRNA pseudouridine(55) synthase TruB [Deltaproteobacteria bacterium]|nr:tRNA pseudouridine(55) synthase TruB [Deltaproteobacteria bacterium]